MNLLRIYRSTYGDKYSFAIPTLDKLSETNNTGSSYGVLIHTRDGYFEKLGINTISTFDLITTIKDSFKNSTIEVVPLKN